MAVTEGHLKQGVRAFALPHFFYYCLLSTAYYLRTAVFSLPAFPARLAFLAVFLQRINSLFIYPQIINPLQLFFVK